MSTGALWNCASWREVPQALLSPKPLTAIFWWITWLSATPPQSKLQLTWALSATLTHSLSWGVKATLLSLCKSELLALAIPIQCSAPGSHQSQPTSTGAMPPWADVNRALNLKLEHGCSKPGIFPVSPRKAMLPALCFVVRHVIIWHHLLSSEICWNKRNVELSLRGKNKVYSLKS